MKIILSSQHLAKHLSGVDFDGGRYVQSVYTQPHRLFIVLVDDSEIKLVIHGESDSTTEKINQSNCRWDHLLNVVKNIVDQPIILQIEDGILKMTIHF